MNREIGESISSKNLPVERDSRILKTLISTPYINVYKIVTKYKIYWSIPISRNCKSLNLSQTPKKLKWWKWPRPPCSATNFLSEGRSVSGCVQMCGAHFHNRILNRSVIPRPHGLTTSWLAVKDSNFVSSLPLTPWFEVRHLRSLSQLSHTLCTCALFLIRDEIF